MLPIQAGQTQNVPALLWDGAEKNNNNNNSDIASVIKASRTERIYLISERTNKRSFGNKLHTNGTMQGSFSIDFFYSDSVHSCL